MITDEQLSNLVELQACAVEKEGQAKQAMSEYKAGCKALFGVEDGTPINLVQLAMLVKKVTGND
jgi:hypothetical protein